jgi:uncharacterized membrane protein
MDLLLLLLPGQLLLWMLLLLLLLAVPKEHLHICQKKSHQQAQAWVPDLLWLLLLLLLLLLLVGWAHLLATLHRSCLTDQALGHHLLLRLPEVVGALHLSFAQRQIARQLFEMCWVA